MAKHRLERIHTRRNSQSRYGRISKTAEKEHAKGNPFRRHPYWRLYGRLRDGVLARAKAIRYRAPHTTNADFRKAVNNGEIAYNDIHLSQMAQEPATASWASVDIAIIEACEVTPDGKIYLTAAGGISPPYAAWPGPHHQELNAAHSTNSMGLHDVYELPDPPRRREIPIYKAERPHRTALHSG